MYPKLAMCNFSKNPKKLKEFAQKYGFTGCDWSFSMDSIPTSPKEESAWIKTIHTLVPLEVRYHCPFYKMDLGADDPEDATLAAMLFEKIIRLVSKVGGKYLSIHIGLGYESTEPLSWDRTIDNLSRLKNYAAERGVTICLENLAWGWTSKPHLFEKIIRGSGVGVTFDLGHAHVSEAVRSQYYGMEDFVVPHADRVYNAHVYHTEIEGVGHVPPEQVEDVAERLALLRSIDCPWWVMEVHHEVGLLQTKRIVDAYLTETAV